MSAKHWILILLAILVFLPEFSYADPAGGENLADTCTDQPIFDISRIEGFLQEIIDTVSATLDTIARNLFENIVSDPRFQNSVLAAIALYISFYGISFMFGFVPASFYVAFMRILKVSFVLLLFNDVAWSFLFDTTTGAGLISGIFQDGVCYMINVMLAIGQGEDPTFADCYLGSPDEPFGLMNGIMSLLLSPRMFIIILSAFTTGPFGFILALGLIGAVTYVLRMTLEALRIYVMYLIVKTLLFGLAPIFFTFMLFDRTKHIFEGWLSTLASISLQTVLIFAYLSFYVVLIESAAWDMVKGVDACYTKFANVGEGRPEDIQTWRFMVDGKMYEGQWSWKGIVDPTADPKLKPKLDMIFPINPLKIMIFLLIAYIGYNMMNVVSGLANNLVGGINLGGLGGKLNEKLSGFTQGGGMGGFGKK